MKEIFEGGKPLESLLLHCRENNIKASKYSSVKNPRFVQLLIEVEEVTPSEILKCILSEAERYGNTNVNVQCSTMYTTISKKLKMCINIFSEYVLQSDRLWERFSNAILEKSIDEKYQIFCEIIELCNFAFKRNCVLNCKMKILAYCVYEIEITVYGTKNNMECFSVLWDKYAVHCFEEDNKKRWIFKTGDKILLRNILNRICDMNE